MIAGEEGVDLRAQRRIVPTRFRQIRRTPIRRQIKRTVKDLGDDPPAFRVHRVRWPGSLSV
jgi:hypothetical protein